MNLVELDRALRQLRLSGMAAVLETRLRQAQAEKGAPIDLVSALVTDEWSPTNCADARTAYSNAVISLRAFATPIARSTISILISTRR